MIDLRSDTVTRPTAAMREAMAGAVVGDDAYGEDPTVGRLECRFADLVGLPAAVYVPSGTMGNLVAVKVHTRPGDVVLAGARQHVTLYEHGAVAALAGAQLVGVDDTAGALDPARLLEVGRRHVAAGTRVGLICIENTHMAAGGVPVDEKAIGVVADVAATLGASVHVDGARLWNASVALDVPMASLCRRVDSVSSCVSKGVGAPVGSLLAGTEEFVAAGRVERQRLGGQLRQAGVLAAAALVGMDDYEVRLARDHRNAHRLAAAVASRWPDVGFAVEDVRTNVVCFRPPSPDAVLDHLIRHEVLAACSEPGTIRLVTHHQLDDLDVEVACSSLLHAP